VNARALAIVLLLLPTLAGCMGTIRSTTTPRSATETLLISNAAQRAVADFDLSAVKGKRVYLDARFLRSVDQGYVESALWQGLAQAGGVLSEGREQAEVVVEIGCAALGTWEGDFELGFPELPVQAQPDLAVLSPELTLGYSPRQGWAKLQLFGYDAATGAVCVAPQTVWGASSGRSPYDLFGDVYPKLLDELRRRNR